MVVGNPEKGACLKTGVEGTEDQGGGQCRPDETSRWRHPVEACGGVGSQRGVCTER